MDRCDTLLGWHDPIVLERSAAWNVDREHILIVTNCNRRDRRRYRAIGTRNIPHDQRTG